MSQGPALGAASAAAALGGMGLVGALPGSALAHGRGASSPNNTPENILNVAATAEVLATIVNTVAFRRSLGGDAVTQRNLGAAAQEELRHYDGLGATPATKRIWVPDAVFRNRSSLKRTPTDPDVNTPDPTPIDC